MATHGFKPSTTKTTTRFTQDKGRYYTILDLRTSPASRLNQKCFQNATIAMETGRLPRDLVVRTNGGKILFNVPTLSDAETVHEWLQAFESNWGNSKL